MWGYFISLLSVILLVILSIVFLNRFSIQCNDKSVEIIIDGNEATEELEKLILSAKIVTDRHFKGARIYIHGGNEPEVDILCKRYGIIKK